MSAPDGGALSCQEQKANYWFWTAEEFCHLSQRSVHHCVTDAGQMHTPSHHRGYFSVFGFFSIFKTDYFQMCPLFFWRESQNQPDRPSPLRRQFCAKAKRNILQPIIIILRRQNCNANLSQNEVLLSHAKIIIII